MGSSLACGAPGLLGGDGDVGGPGHDGVTVDTSSRSEVVAIWNRYFAASSGAGGVMNWSGAYGTCTPGENSIEFTEAIERRINFYRALAGISSDTVTNSGAPVVIASGDNHVPSASTSKWSASQRAALMFSWADYYQAGSLSHNSPSTQPPYYCWSSAAWNAAKNSNLAVGFCGPDAVDAYMRENDPQTLSVWNSSVGHRRWLLKQGVTDFASGDVPGDANRRPANVLYVRPASEEMVAVTPVFAAWPAAGHFPDELMAKHWSLSHPGANFSGASVSVTRESGAPVAVSIIDRSTLGVGDPTIVWSVPDSVAQPSVTADTRYDVVVSGIVIDGESVTHSYSVTVIDPDRIPDSLAITGTVSPPLSGANYFFEPVGGAEGHAILASVSAPVSWTAGAEDADPTGILDGTSDVYPLRNPGGFVRSGGKAFRLVFPAATELGDQSFTLDASVTGGTAGSMNYYLRRGYMTPGMGIEVMFSSDGQNWETVDSISGTSSQFTDDNSFKLRSVPLPEGVPVRVRFRLKYGGGVIYIASSHPSAGAFIDDISFTDADWTIAESEVIGEETEGFIRVASSDLVPSPAVGESVGLRLKAPIGGRGYVAPAPLMVTFVAGSDGFDEWLSAEFPQVTGGFDGDHDVDGLSNGLEYAFGLNPMSASTLSQTFTHDGSGLALTTPLAATRNDVLYELQVSEDLSGSSTTGTSVQHSGGQLIGTAPRSGTKGFARWKVTEQ